MSKVTILVDGEKVLSFELKGRDLPEALIEAGYKLSVERDTVKFEHLHGESH